MSLRSISLGVLAATTLAALLGCSSSSGGGGAGGSPASGSTGDGGTIAICGTAPGGSCVQGSDCTDSMGNATDITTLEQGCKSGGGTWSTQRCDASNYVGGCCISVGVTSAQTYWVPASNSSASAQQTQCWGMAGEWFTP
jgi:hypothetical protein